KEHYETLADFAFVLVEIESLLSPQWFADLDYIDEIAAQTPEAMTLNDKLRFAMSEGKITQPIVTGNVVHFTSPRRDLFASPIPFVRETSHVLFDVTVERES